MSERTRGDTFITIRSKDLTNLNTEGSSGRFVLFENIIADEHEVLSISCVSAIIPNSFLNISAHNKNNKYIINLIINNLIKIDFKITQCVTYLPSTQHYTLAGSNITQHSM